MLEHSSFTSYVSFLSICPSSLLVELTAVLQEHALCDLPSPLYPEAYASGVALSTTRIAERAGYSHDDNAFMSLEMLKDICPAIPVHTIYGSNRDLMCVFSISRPAVPV